MIVGKRLKERRKALGLTQADIGNMLGVGKAAVCCYEKEVRNPSIESIIELMQILGVSADFLLGTDLVVKTFEDKKPRFKTMTNEEVKFIEELRKDKIVYEILFDDPKRGSELVKRNLG